MARTTNDDIKPLSETWCPPSTILGTDQGPGHPLVCLATTYTFSAVLLETELLPRFLNLKFDPAERESTFLVERDEALANINAAVLVDQSKVDNRQTTLRWDQVAVRVPQAIQHAKVTILVWERMVRLIVGSANLSLPGYRHNREIVGVIDFFNDPQSPPRLILTDALKFFETVMAFAVAEPHVIKRIRSAIEAVADRARTWDKAPRKFTPREYPRVQFVANLPNAKGGVKCSILKEVKKIWGNRKAIDIRVVTPFVGNPDSRFENLVKELAELPHFPSAQIQLAVPGEKSEASKNHHVVMLPRTFWDAWSQRWNLDAAPTPACVVTSQGVHMGRDVNRPLHAKGIFVHDTEISLLCCGSSNFSASGMGVGRANVEANLVYLDKRRSKLDNLGLENRLPVDWDRNRSRNVTWSGPPQDADEDLEVIGLTIPSVFLWAAFESTRKPAAATLRVALDASRPLPKTWALRLGDSSAPAIASNEQYPMMPADGQLKIALPSESADFPPTTVRVFWHDGEISGDAVLPVQVADRNSLPAPDKLRSLTAENILACLLSGCDPAEWVDREIDRENRHDGTPAVDPRLDPHRYHDPSGLTLYRVRRLGRGLAAMGQRLARTVRTPEAVEHQLNRHPLGPMHLAEAMVTDADTNSAAASRIDRARLVFSLLEIGLMLAHAGKQLHRQRQRGEADHRPRFRRAISEVLRRAKERMQADGSLGVGEARTSDSLHRYCESVEQQAVELLSGLYFEEEEAVCL